MPVWISAVDISDMGSSADVDMYGPVMGLVGPSLSVPVMLMI